MRHNLAMFVLVATSGLPWMSAVGADNNWPNWRGPNYDGSLPEAAPPTHWSSTQNIAWKTPLPGKGSGSPIVWENQIILLAAVDTGKTPAGMTPSVPAQQADPNNNSRGGGRALSESPPLTVFEFLMLAYDLGTGQELWRTTLTRAVPHEGGHRTNTFASSSAVTDGKHIFASCGSRGIFCVDMQGKLLWSRELGQMKTRNEFGEGSSPALAGDKLIVPWDHEGPSAVFGLDTATGEVLWKTARDEPTTWATPLVVTGNDRTQVILNGTVVRSYDVATGQLLWECGGQVTNPIPCPIRTAGGVVCMTGYRGNSIYALPLNERGDLTNSSKILWENHDAAPYVASATLYQGRLYLTKERTGTMTALDASTGRVVIPQTRLSNIRDVYASPVAAGGKIYFTGRDGVTVVIQHADEPVELAVNELGEPVDASPAVVGKRLIVRGAEHLFCISE